MSTHPLLLPLRNPAWLTSLLMLRPSRRTVSAAAAAGPIVIGSISLLGWVIGSTMLQSVFVGSITVRANAGVALLLLGIALMLPLRWEGVGWAKAVSAVLCLFVALVAILTVAEFAYGADLGIDAVLFRAGDDPTLTFPERMSLMSALGLLLAAAAGATSATDRTRGPMTVLLAALAATVGGMAILGLLFGSTEVTTLLSGGSSIPAPTAVGIVMVAASILANPRVHGPHDVLGYVTPGGDVARVLLFGSIVLLPTLGFLGVLGEAAGLYGTASGVAIQVTVAIVCLSGVGVILGKRLDLADRARLEAEREFLRAIELSSDAICVIDSSGNFKELNPAWTTLLGHPLDELISHPFIDFVHPDDLARTIAEYSELTRHERAPGFVNRFRHSDGTYRSIEWASQFSPETGLVYGIARDVTERAKMEREQALLAAIIESTGDAVISVDLEGRILSWNPGAERLYGYDECDVTGRDFTFVVPPDRDDEVALRREQLASGAAVQNWETTRMTRDGPRIPVILTISPLRDSTGELIGETEMARDITDRLATRERLLAANRTLEKRNKELRDFGSIVSHDLRAPLRRMQMFADMAADAPGKDPDVTDLVNRIRSSAARMEELVVDLLTYARIGSSASAMRLVDLNAVLEEAIDDQGPAILDRGIHIDATDLPTIEGDPVLLRQLFTNLIGNAVKFSGEEAAPVISISSVVAPSGDAEPAMATIEVQDNGIGFEPQYEERIFEIFERLSTDFAGTGVGLAICRKVCDLHGGTIEASSEHHMGATFTLRLPIAQP